MKNLLRFAVAGALVAGSAAQAQTPALPSTDASDLWLFVADTAAAQTFALDTGIPVASLLPSGSLSAGSVLSTAINDAGLSNGAATAIPNVALTAFIDAANAAGQQLTWGVVELNYPGTLTRYPAQGAEVLIFDDPGSATGISSTNPNKMFTISAGFASDLGSFVVPTYTTGGKTYAWSLPGAAINVWGAGTGAVGGSTNLYGQEPNQAVDATGTLPFTLGRAVPLYGLTGNNSLAAGQSYVLANLELTATGALIAPVPLPATVWLFGTGLLGVLGARRRS
jgi:hypothetical protein